MTDDQIERMAEAIHEQYRETMKRLPPDTTRGPLAEISWEQLSPADKEANREQARDIVVKIEAMGFTLVPANDNATEQLTVSADFLEALAEYEHQRWMMHKIDTGWTFGSERNDDLRVHPLIVPYADLSAAQKELDREPVRHILTLLAEAGWAVTREDDG